MRMQFQALLHHGGICHHANMVWCESISLLRNFSCKLLTLCNAKNYEQV